METYHQINPANIENLICVRIFNDRLAAETAASFLESNGIASCINTDDCGGFLQVFSGGGARLYVIEGQSEAALTLLSFHSPIKPASYRGFFKPSKLPKDRPKLIIVVGIWMIFGIGLALQLKGLFFASQILPDGLMKIFQFVWTAIGIFFVVYTLLRSVRNYSIQKRRAMKRDHRH